MMENDSKIKQHAQELKRLLLEETYVKPHFLELVKLLDNCILNDDVLRFKNIDATPPADIGGDVHKAKPIYPPEPE